MSMLGPGCCCEDPLPNVTCSISSGTLSWTATNATNVWAVQTCYNTGSAVDTTISLSGSSGSFSTTAGCSYQVFGENATGQSSSEPCYEPSIPDPLDCPCPDASALEYFGLAMVFYDHPQDYDGLATYQNIPDGRTNKTAYQWTGIGNVMNFTLLGQLKDDGSCIISNAVNLTGSVSLYVEANGEWWTATWSGGATRSFSNLGNHRYRSSGSGFGVYTTQTQSSGWPGGDPPLSIYPGLCNPQLNIFGGLITNEPYAHLCPFDDAQYSAPGTVKTCTYSGASGGSSSYTWFRF